MKLTEQIEFKALNKTLEKLEKFESEHDWIEYFISPIIVALVVLTVFAIKGVYPFGVNTIAYYDMPTQYVPFYSNAWDILHGKAGLFLCWYYGLGVPGAAGFGQFVLFPTNAFLFFTSRDNILYALSFLLLIKMVLSAFTMSFYCKRRQETTTWIVCAGILYACCGYVIQYYTNMFFLDYVILFPVIVWSFERLMKEQKYGMFIFFLSLAFISNFQLSAMVVIYLIIKAYFILDSIPDEMKGRSLRLFALAGICAALMCSFVMIPSLIVSLSSSRIDENEKFNYLETLKTVYCYFRKEKQFMMYCGEVAVGLFALVIIRGKNVIKKYRKNLIMILVTSLPIIMEGMNILWHFGSYKHFPIRFGYMITFELLVFVGEYIKNEEFNSNVILNRIAKIIGVAIIPFVAYILYGFFDQFLYMGISDIKPYQSYKIYFLTLSISYFIIFLINEKRTRNFVLIMLCLVQAFCGCYGMIAPEAGFSDGFRVSYLLDTLENKQNIYDYDLKKTERIKSSAIDYEPNYGAIIEHPSIGLWAYGIPSDTESLLTKKLGYHGDRSCVMDDGGTAFTDALLGVTKVLSNHNDDSILYNEIDSSIGLYECVYKIPFGVIANDDMIESDKSMFEFNNDLYRKISGSSNELIKIKEADKLITNRVELTDAQIEEFRHNFEKHYPLKRRENIENNKIDSQEENIAGEIEDQSLDEIISENEQKQQTAKEFTLNIKVESKKSVYLTVDEGFSGELSLIANDDYLFFSSFQEENLYTYPNRIYKGIVALGSYDDETLELKVYTMNEDLKGVKIGLLDLEELSKGIEIIKKNQDLEVECLKNGLRATGKVNKDGTLFFPVGYSKDWHVKVNGKSAHVKPYINNAFIAVDVNKGDVDIDFWYWPQGLTIGIILTIVAIVLLITLNLVMKKGGVAGKKYETIVDNITIYAFKTVAVVILIVMYVIPICVKMSL